MSKKKTDVNPLDQLAGLAGKSSSKKKSEVPVVEAPDEVAEAVASFLQGKQMATDGAAMQKVVAPAIRKYGEQERLRLCKAAKAIVPTVKIAANGCVVEHTVKFAYSGVDRVGDDGFKPLEALRAIFKKKTDSLFKIVTSLKFTKKALDDEKFLTELLTFLQATLGDSLGEYLDMPQEVVPTQEYHSQKFLNQKFRKLAEEAETEGLVCPHKPTLKAPRSK